MEFPRETFGAISPNAISLIQSLTKTDPSERLSCAAALTHPWLAEGAKQTAALPEALQQNRRASVVRRKSGSLGSCSDDDLGAAAREAAAAVLDVDGDGGGGGGGGGAGAAAAEGGGGGEGGAAEGGGDGRAGGDADDIGTGTESWPHQRLT